MSLETWVDRNDNGERDRGEEPLAGVKIRAEWYRNLVGPDCSQLANKEVIDLTSDATGHTEFLAKGWGCDSVKFRVETPSGYRLTTRDELYENEWGEFHSVFGFAPLP
jgi:hypothetical protein